MRTAAMLLLTALLLLAALLLTGAALNIRLGTGAGAKQEIPDRFALLERELARQFASRSASITASYKGDPARLNESLAGVIRKALERDDYTAYILDSYAYTIRSRGDDSSIRLQVRYRETAAQTAEVDREVNSELKRMLRPGMSADEKVKAVHDWVVKRLAYDESLRRYTAYEALRYGRAVCQGYALLTYKMLTAAGIPARIVEGKVASGDHAWNLVLLGGRWYHMDTTWDDPLPDRPGKASYAYYLKTDAQMRADHSWTRAYPEAVTEYAGRM